MMNYYVSSSTTTHHYSSCPILLDNNPKFLFTWSPSCVLRHHRNPNPNPLTVDGLDRNNECATVLIHRVASAHV